VCVCVCVCGVMSEDLIHVCSVMVCDALLGRESISLSSGSESVRGHCG
jgi:hypothetical protein